MTSTATPSAASAPAAARKERKQQTTVNPVLVRCICITLTFFVTGCGVLAFGVSCVVLKLLDEAAGPCPYNLTITVFSVSGGLFAAGLVLLLHLCSRKKRLNKEALLTELPVKEEVAHYKKKLSNAGVDEVVVVMPPTTEEVGAVVNRDNEEVLPEVPLDTSEEVQNFAMTQKSADVSYWIEQQKPEDIPTFETFSINPKDGATTNEIEKADSDGEMTSL